MGSFGYCGLEPVCTAECDRCLIDGQCVKKDWANPENVCEKCVPDENQKAWSDTCPQCTPQCQNGGLCEGDQSGRSCNCENTGFLGSDCSMEPSCTPECKNGGICAIDDYS